VPDETEAVRIARLEERVRVLEREAKDRKDREHFLINAMIALSAVVVATVPILILIATSR
jgi:hypothetical protein